MLCSLRLQSHLMAVCSTQSAPEAIKGRTARPRLAIRCHASRDRSTPPTLPATPQRSSRRSLLSAAAAAVAALAARPPAARAMLLPPPHVGDCPDGCIGEVNATLNACQLESQSCVSTLNDDQAHFMAPWQYDGSREDAIARLVDVATGGEYEAGLLDTFGGVSQLEAAAYIAKGTLAVATGGELPERPKPKRKSAADLKRFDGAVADRHAAADGSEYIRVVLGADRGQATEVEDPLQVVDCEFLFLPNDNIVTVRAASRAEPEGSLAGARPQLSLTEGLVLDRNVARRRMDSLRTALRWEIVPVITEFDPAFNSDAPIWFERLFDPFNRRKAGFELSGEAYPAAGGR